MFTVEPRSIVGSGATDVAPACRGISANADIGLVGSGLHRPECVLATAVGDLYVSDSRGGVTRIGHGGEQRLFTGRSADLCGPVHPNGIALEADGSFLMAHLTDDRGGVFRLRRNGEVVPVLLEVDGMPLPPTNFVSRDREGRMWVTVSTRVLPRDHDYRKESGSGFVVMDDGLGARVVAEGLGYANECGVSPDGRWLYVVETFARRLSRYSLRSGGGLGARETVAELGRGEFPDGMAFDVNGGVLLSCIIGNRLLRVAPDGRIEVLLDVGDPAYVDEVEAAYEAGTMGRAHMYSTGASAYGSFSSVALGGADMQTAYVGSFMASSLVSLRLPYAGMPPPHWSYGAD